ncbi:MAG: MoxR family ATPase [Deltaproteobacteria bacterium]|nr:MoxR family ATPase [Deltaproteobacteria bacterium]
MQNSPLKSPAPPHPTNGNSTKDASEIPTPSQASARLQDVIENIGRVIRGNDEAITLSLACILARGHVLIEDVPGVGKTTLARTVAKVLGCDFSRIQFTADLLPSDVIGVQILDPKTGELRFRRGPIFSHLVLADEINRASPKTQSALLEAMSDRQISVDETSHRLEGPFSVLATQNPVEHHGTYPLPESQLDRFMVVLSLGYPSHDDEKNLLQNHRGPEASIQELEPILNPSLIVSYAKAVEEVEINDAVAEYLLRLVKETRVHSAIHLGCSPRGGLAWAQLARALAYMGGRDFVLPDDVKRTAPFVLTHRIALKGAMDGPLARRETQGIIQEILSQTQAPR